MGTAIRRYATLLVLLVIGVALPGTFESEEPPVPSPTPAPGFSDVQIRLTNITPLKQAVAFAVRHDDPRIFVATQDGRVFAVHNRRARVVLDIRRYVMNKGEAGLLGLTFTPNGKRMVVNFVNHDGDSRIRSYRFGDDGPIDRGQPLLDIDHPDFTQHYAGTMAFGPDGYLYISHGDGGLQRDPNNRGQSLDVLLGKILRIEVRASGKYSVPSDNPFVGRPDARPEIWDYGFRNPWRFSFDVKTGDLWMTDVGLVKREEINVEPAHSKGGRNYGWNRFEGTLHVHGEVPPDHVLPRYELEHGEPFCALIGGFVYRGFKVPGLYGAYIYGDLCSGRMWALRGRPGHSRRRGLPGKVDQLTAFGEDAAGELYVLSLNDGVFRIDPA